MTAAARPFVALFPWGLVLEDFLEPHGLTLDGFCREFRGSWMFGYVEALRSVGVRTVVVAVSAGERQVTWRVHEPSGADVLVVPAPRAYRALRRRMTNPYGRTAQATFPLAGRGRLLWAFAAVATQIAPFLSTPRRALARELEKAGCTAMLCQEYEFPRFDACVGVSRRLGIPIFATFQGGDYRRWRLERLTRARAVGAARGLIVASAAEAERVERTYGVPSDRIARIPNPVDTERWRPGDRAAARARVGIAASERVAVWHGRVHVWKKGLDVLLDAWRAVEPGAPAARLVLIGDGPDASGFEARLAELGDERITFVRSLINDPAMLRDYLVAADVYVFPSRHEGFAVAPIEAMACGLPLVAAAAGGIAEALPDGEESGGLVVPVEDPSALGGALARLLGDVELADRLGGQARRRAVEAFSYAAVGERLAGFLSG